MVCHATNILIWRCFLVFSFSVPKKKKNYQAVYGWLNFIVLDKNTFCLLAALYIHSATQQMLSHQLVFLTWTGTISGEIVRCACVGWTWGSFLSFFLLYHLQTNVKHPNIWRIFISIYFKKGMHTYYLWRLTSLKSIHLLLLIYTSHFPHRLCGSLT